ncbi:hypothetical protein CVT25_001405 [Psilocybe cyanescens]|uniref:Uncharacterized protein n=1 Tax=Psilocybe cyanescens TaxID=93625 RepID=A0A409WNF6_PSICY|nr:hypothetical protein CVT25_001405 [Psilocybe cyanescens]
MSREDDMTHVIYEAEGLSRCFDVPAIHIPLFSSPFPPSMRHVCQAELYIMLSALNQISTTYIAFLQAKNSFRPPLGFIMHHYQDISQVLTQCIVFRKPWNLEPNLSFSG